MGTSIEVLEEEAKRNFETKRYIDAAKTYEHLLRLTLKASKFDYKKAINYGLAAVKAWNKTDSPENMASVLFSIGTACTREAARLFEQIGHQKIDTDPIAAANVLKRAATSYERIENYEIHSKLLEEAGEIFQNEALQAKNLGNSSESVVLFERAMDCFRNAGKRKENQTAAHLAIFQLIQMEKVGMISLTGEGCLLLTELLESIGDKEMANHYREKADQLIEDIY